MTDQRLRELVHDLADDLTPHDRVQPLRADHAWQAAARRRRRSRVAVVGGIAAAAVAVAGGTRWLADDDTNERPGRGPATSSPSPTGPAPYDDARGDRRPDARVDGGAVYWSPTPAQEIRLPRVGGSGLPATIDLAAEAPPVEEQPVSEVRAAFAVFGDDGIERVLLVVPGGVYRTLDVSRLDQVTQPDGYRVDPEGQSMVSPRGQYLMFPQDGHLEIYVVATGEWRRIPTGSAVTAYATWSYDDGIYLQPRRGGGLARVIAPDGGPGGQADLRPPGKGSRTLRDATPYGRHRTGPGGEAQSWSRGAGIPVPDSALPDPEVLVTTLRDAPLLAFIEEADAPTRWKECCPVAGWLDEDQVVYESRGAHPRLVAWRVGTHSFRTVAEIGGLDVGRQWYVASFARFWMP